MNAVNQRRLRALKNKDEEKHVMMMRYDNEEKQLQNARKTRIKLKDYELIKIIIKGKWSELRIVRNRYDNIIYTMKAIAKKDLIAKNRVSHIYSPKDLMIDTDYTFLVKIQHLFQDDIYKYILMDYYPCDLMFILMEQHILTEKQTMFYMAELAVGINAIHEIDFVHRDLKPNNILITKEGHIKLSDYGLSKAFITENDQIISKYQTMKHTINIKHDDMNKKQKHRDTKSMGTADYMAPEVFGQKGYDQMVDWWSMGIIMFECLIGYTPFYQQGDDLQTCRKIVHYRKYFKIPRHVTLSKESVDLLHNLICSYRRRYSFEQIKKHSFFKQIEWNNLKMTKPPFIPVIIGNIEILIFGYIRIIRQKFELLHDIPHDIIKLISLIHGYQELKILSSKEAE